jgi:hypothetical protein
VPTPRAPTGLALCHETPDFLPSGPGHTPVPSGRAPAGQCAVRPVGEHRPRRNIIHGGSVHLTGHSMRVVSAPSPTLTGAFHGSEG